MNRADSTIAVADHFSRDRHEHRSLMKVHLLPPGRVVSALGHRAEASYLGLLELTGHCPEHSFVSKPDDADIILAPIFGDSYGPFFEKLKRSPIYKKSGHKLFVYTIDDFQFPALPGIYPAITPDWAARGWAVGGHYVTNYHHKHEFENLPPRERDILFSFVGSSWTHPIRERVLALKHPRGVLDDSERKGEAVHWWLRGQDHFKNRLALFENVLNRTKFALCPRGYAAASMRLFQAFQAGAVPVVLADSFVFPIGPDWNKISIQIKESDLERVPQILEQMEPRFPGMSIAARKAWEDWFSPEHTLRSMVLWCEHLLKTLTVEKRAQLERLALMHSWFNARNIRMRMRRAKRTFLTANKSKT